MQYGRKRWLARIRNGGHGGHGAHAVRRDQRPCRDRVAGAGLRQPHRPLPACPVAARVWSCEPGRASGCDTTTARCRRFVLREGGGGRDAKRNVSGASGSGRERGARAQGEHATATALKGLSLAQVRRINWRHKLYAGCAHLRDRRRTKTGRKCVNRSSLAQIKSDR